MAKLIYMAITSLDGYIEDVEGRFDWAMPDAEVHAFVNDLERPIGTHLYGRRMYETMAVWQTVGDEPGVSAAEADFAEEWRALDKVVYSRTLDAVSTHRTRLEREFEPEAVRRMKEAADRDISVSGPGLAQHAFRAGLVDEVYLFVFPSSSAAGNRDCPGTSGWTSSSLDERRFGNGVVHLHYRTRSMTRVPADLASIARAIIDANLYMVLGTADEAGASVGVAGVLRTRQLSRVLLGLASRGKTLAEPRGASPARHRHLRLVGRHRHRPGGLHVGRRRAARRHRTRRRASRSSPDRSLAHGGHAWTPSDVEPPAQLRLFRAIRGDDLPFSTRTTGAWP